LGESAKLVDGAPGAHLAEATRRAIVTPGTVMLPAVLVLPSPLPHRRASVGIDVTPVETGYSELLCRTERDDEEPMEIAYRRASASIEVMQFIHTMDVPKPAAAVHAYVSDFKNLPRWDPTIVKVEQTTPGPVGQGTRYVVVLKFVGSETTLDYQVREYAPPISAMLVGVASSAVATDKITIEPTPTGSRLTWHADITLSWPAKIVTARCSPSGRV